MNIKHPKSAIGPREFLIQARERSQREVWWSTVPESLSSPLPPPASLSLVPALPALFQPRLTADLQTIFCRIPPPDGYPPANTALPLPS